MSEGTYDELQSQRSISQSLHASERNSIATVGHLLRSYDGTGTSMAPGVPKPPSAHYRAV